MLTNEDKKWIRDEIKHGVNAETSDLREDVNDLKETVVNIQSDITSMKGDIASMKGDITSMKGDIASMKGEITSMKSDITSMKSDINSMKSDITSMKMMYENQYLPLFKDLAQMHHDAETTYVKRCDEIDRMKTENEVFVAVKTDHEVRIKALEAIVATKQLVRG